MKRIQIRLLSVLLAGLVAGCGSSDKSSKDIAKNSAPIFDSTAVKKIIEVKTNKFTQAHITKDTAFLNNIFTVDARVYAPNADAVIGRPAILLVNVEWVNYGIMEFREESTVFYGNEEYVIDEGIYYLRYGEIGTIDKGKYINIWKNENGDWKIYSNIWNTSLPAVSVK